MSTSAAIPDVISLAGSSCTLKTNVLPAGGPQTAAPNLNWVTLSEKSPNDWSSQITIFICLLSSQASNKDVFLFIPQHSWLAFSLSLFVRVYFITKRKIFLVLILYYLVISSFYACVWKMLLQFTWFYCHLRILTTVLFTFSLALETMWEERRNQVKNCIFLFFFTVWTIILSPCQDQHTASLYILNIAYLKSEQ